MMRSTLGRAAAVLALVTAATTFAPSALAGDPGLAEHLFKEGVTAMAKNDWVAACEAFAGSNDADPSPGTEINLGVCNERQGKTATAWGWYRTAAGLAEQRSSRDRAELARKEADRLEPKLRKLVVVLKDPTAGITVTRDGASLPNATIGREIPVDPGEHVIEASAKGKETYKTTVRLQPGPGVDRIEIPALVDSPAAAAAPPATALPKGGEAGYPPEPQRDGSTQRTIGYVVGAGGIVALIVAGTLEILAIDVRSKQKDAQNTLDEERRRVVPPTPARVTELEDAIKNNKSQADGNQLGAIATGIGGVVLIGTGLVLVFTAPSGKSSGKLKLPPVMPVLGQGYAGAGATFAF
jgi:hypothetical protein